ncbi:ornithine cyclodeaminase [Roseibium hamelinense]|uniref:Ornithine cyclodeaminase n=1 Tax=Roseibium hamelinense TaxID=150831 RepID=A0A562TGJ7_9HYPH|nr:ornithine cyclodeaminase family protein [Roseibium hamelinense]MTI46098.1 ornithine cyclodeaminase family protein [Roseibium hamelinense]TWI92709.1 ornithine cyclodeaminase [Roseibium hamelinense]
MLLLSESETQNALPFPGLIDALADMFKTGCDMPVRHHHDMKVPGEPDATMLLMPAWVPGTYAGVKIAYVVPGNSARSLPAVSASYMLSDAATGAPLALVDGGELTARRTAAASALASRYLARPDARRLLIVGTGRLSINLAGAHAAARPIETVQVWGRSLEKAQAVADAVTAAFGIKASAVSDLEGACAEADIISAATLSQDPLIKGAWLQPGTHVDLVGAFKPSMRESDDEAVQRATVFVDTRDGCTKEGGDIVQPLQSGVLKPGDIAADLYELTRGTHPGRKAPDEITLFKSVGAALEDLAGAILAYQTASKG